MVRGRHAKPSGLLSRLFPGRAERHARRRAIAAQERALLRELRFEVDRVRSVATALSAEASTAADRARQAEAQARIAQAQVEDLRTETAALRTEVARLREEMLWAWAEGRLPSGAGMAVDAGAAGPGAEARVIDLREASGS